MSTLTPTAVKNRVLIIEDDDDVRRSLTLMLRARGYTLDVYKGGPELLATGYLPSTDCILMDYKMPKIDGIRLLKRLRDAGLTAPALLITGFYSFALQADAERAGFSAVIEKPASADLLASWIDRVTGTEADS